MNNQLVHRYDQRQELNEETDILFSLPNRLNWLFKKESADLVLIKVILINCIEVADEQEDEFRGVISTLKKFIKEKDVKTSARLSKMEERLESKVDRIMNHLLK